MLGCWFTSDNKNFGCPDSCKQGTLPRCGTPIPTILFAGATDFLASIFPVGEDEEASIARTTSLLKSLIGNI